MGFFPFEKKDKVPAPQLKCLGMSNHGFFQNTNEVSEGDIANFFSQSELTPKQRKKIKGLRLRPVLLVSLNKKHYDELDELYGLFWSENTKCLYEIHTIFSETAFFSIPEVTFCKTTLLGVQNRLQENALGYNPDPRRDFSSLLAAVIDHMKLSSVTEPLKEAAQPKKPRPKL